MTELNINWFLALSAVMFSIGVIGVLVRRNAIVMFMCVELMLNAVNLSLLSFSSFHGNIEGQILVFFSLAVAAAEAVVGLAIIIAIFRNNQTVDVGKINLLRW
jgi:NADH-quinone oxidoreductase subunit K